MAAAALNCGMADPHARHIRDAVAAARHAGSDSVPIFADFHEFTRPSGLNLFPERHFLPQYTALILHSFYRGSAQMPKPHQKSGSRRIRFLSLRYCGMMIGGKQMDHLPGFNGLDQIAVHARLLRFFNIL